MSRDVKFLDEFSDNPNSDSFIPTNLFDPVPINLKPGKENDQIVVTFDENSNRENSEPQNDELNNLPDEVNHHDDEPHDQTEDVNYQDEELTLDEEENPNMRNRENELIAPVTIRGRGRPRIVRSGSRGRPRKVYREIQVTPETPNTELTEIQGNVEEFVGIADLTLKQAFSSNEAQAWRDAVKSEYSSIIENQTFKIVDRPKDKNIIGSRVVLKEKLKADGTVERKKARLVAKGFNQRQGEDFNETFAPVVRMSSIRTIMALAVEHDLELHQLDVTTAFLNGDLSERIYMEIPDNFQEILAEIIEDPNSLEDVVHQANQMLKTLQKTRKGEKVCLLQKSLYGLKQAGRQWHLKLHENVMKLGFKQSYSDPCVYYSHRGNDTLILAIYVDDLWLGSQNKKWIEEMKGILIKTFKMKYLGKIHYGLGIEFTQNLSEGKICMSQKKYIQDVLKRFGMEDSKPISTPMEVGLKLTRPEKLDEGVMSKYPYQKLIGSLMYLAVSTRPDIAYTVNWLSQFNSNYTEQHWLAAKRVLRYLKGTAKKGIEFTKTKKPLRGFADADWANCASDRRSYSGFFFELGGAAITWEARKQRTVALSSVEAEYLALGEATKEAIYLRQFLTELGLSRPTTSTLILNDNQGAQLLAKNSIHHSRTKHID
ncbi:unnamed protein product, partial [Nesidiocoris tenuis]